MTWTFLFGGEFNQTRNNWDSLIIPGLFSYPQLIVGVESDFRARDAGLLKQLLLGFPKPRILGYRQSLSFGYQVLDFKYSNGYLLEIIPNSKITSLYIEVYLPEMPLYAVDLPIVSSSTANSTNPSVNGSTASVILASNVDRLGATIFNSTNKNLYIDFDDVVSTSSYALVIPANNYYEIPYSFTGDISGIISGGNSATGNILVREFVP